jgi:hypothetical protein
MSTQVHLGRLTREILGERPVHNGGVALAGAVGFALDGRNPLRGYVIRHPLQLFPWLLGRLLPLTPPGEERLEVWPGVRECLDELRRQGRSRWPCLLPPEMWERRDTLVDLGDLLCPDRAFLAIIRDTLVDIEWRSTVVDLMGTFRSTLGILKSTPWRLSCRRASKDGGIRLVWLRWL